MEESEELVAALRTLYRDNPNYQPVFNNLAGYVNRVASIKVDRVHERVRGNRTAVVHALRALQELGLGTYVKGTWGYASRFDFAPGTGPSRIGLLAQGVEDEDALPDEDFTTDDSDFTVEDAAVEPEWMGEMTLLKEATLEQLFDELKGRGVTAINISL